MHPGSWATRLDSLSILSRLCFWPMSSGVCSSLWQTVCSTHTCLKQGGRETERELESGKSVYASVWEILKHWQRD